jgi:hypothetical protein
LETSWCGFTDGAFGEVAGDESVACAYGIDEWDAERPLSVSHTVD